MKLGWKRLLKLADILDVADAKHKKKREPKYKQDEYAYACGSPACALGHYAVNAKRRGWTIGVHRHMFGDKNWVFLRGVAVDCDGYQVQGEFELNRDEASEIFGQLGCAEAETAKQAARYIRKFVKRKLAELAEARKA